MQYINKQKNAAIYCVIQKFSIPPGSGTYKTFSSVFSRHSLPCNIISLCLKLLSVHVYEQCYFLNCCNFIWYFFLLIYRTFYGRVVGYCIYLGIYSVQRFICGSPGPWWHWRCVRDTYTYRLEQMEIQNKIRTNWERYKPIYFLIFRVLIGGSILFLQYDKMYKQI